MISSIIRQYNKKAIARKIKRESVSLLKVKILVVYAGAEVVGYIVGKISLH